VEIKPKTDGSMGWDASDSSTSNFVVFIVLGHKGSLAISFPINRTPRVGGEDQAINHPSPTP
jgi:hypothetical protein